MKYYIRKYVAFKGFAQKEQGNMGKVFGIVIFISISFFVAIFSVWFLVVKSTPEEVSGNKTGIVENAERQDSTQTMRGIDSLNIGTSLADTSLLQSDAVLLSENDVARKKREWEEYKKQKLKEYLEILKLQAKKEDENLSQIRRLTLVQDSLNRQINQLSVERDQWKKQLEDYKKNVADIVAQEVVKYYKRRDAKKDSIEEVMRQQQLASNGVGIRKLAKIYESMRPEQAAPVLAKLKDDEIINILFKMRQRNAAKIIASFDPQLAARITRKMGGK